MKIVSIISLLLAFSALDTVYGKSTKTVGGKRFICYYGSWSIYRYALAKMTLNQMPSQCTDIVYSFIGLDEVSSKAVFMDPWNDIGDEWKTGSLTTIRKMTKQTGTNVLIAIGGWNEGSQKYSKTVGDPVKRAILVKSLATIVQEHDLDGVDIDWEYPTQRGGSLEDRDNFSNFVVDLATVFHAMGKTVSAAVNANPAMINTCYDVPKIAAYLDYINVMAYDFHGSWDTKTGHNAPLFGHHTDAVGEEHLNVAAAIHKWIDLGCPPQKLNLGIGTYGRSFNLVNPTVNKIGAPARGTPPCGWIDEPGFYAYKEICTNNGTVWKTEWDDEQQIPYAYSGSKWVGYDDERSTLIKTCWAKSLNLGGMMVWSLETDDFDGSCKKGKFPLLNAIASGLQDPSCGAPGNSVPEVTATPPAPETPVPNAPETTTPTAPETTAPSAPETTAPSAPETTTSAEPETTTPPAPETPTSAAPETTTSALPETTSNQNIYEPSESEIYNNNDVLLPSYETTTEKITEVPTATQPNSPVVCKEVGSYIRDPNACNVFYYCAFGADGSIVPNRFSCASQLAFDEQIKTCVFRSATRC